MSETSLSVFLKAPRPGAVKTRLGRGLGRTRATALYRAFTRDALEWMAKFPVSTRRLDYAPADGERECRALCPERSRWNAYPQPNGDLGRRLRSAFDSMFATGNQRCIVVGTDCPTLTPQLLAAGFRALERCDGVLGPTADGGYYLIGLRRPSPELFRRIPWSTERVLATTMRRSAAAGLELELLAQLRDVDTTADLAPLHAALRAAWDRGDSPFPVRTFRELAWIDTQINH